MTRAELIEALADQEHVSWSHWMAYLFSVCVTEPDGSVHIPVHLVERWQRQVNTPYVQLTEPEKESDRHQVNRILPLIEEFAQDFVEPEFSEDSE